MQRSSVETVAAHKQLARVRPLSLDPSPLLPSSLDGWRLTLYPQAGEATVLYLKECSGLSGGVDLPRPERSPEQLEAQHAARAKGEIRRQIRANRGRYLWTFTFAKETKDYGEVVKHVRRFMERLRQAVGKVWLLLVPEPHPGGHGWHLHGATNVRLPHKKVAAAWGQGFVWVGDHGRDRRSWPARKLARYLAKYATKMVGGNRLYGCRPRPRGAHRYWVTQGYEPEKVSLVLPHLQYLKAYLLSHVGMWDEWRKLELEPDVPAEGWWISWPDACLAPAPSG